MIPAATTWLAYVVLFGAVAWLSATRLATAAFVLAAIATLPAALLPLSNCAPWQPAPGEYTVRGARIDVDKAIHVFLDNGSGAPRCYSLPYSKGQAEALQEAIDGGGAVGAKVSGEGGDGGVAFDGEPPVQANEAKRAETPAFEVGG